MVQVVFKRGCGKGNNPPRSLRDRIERAMIRLAVIAPADGSVAVAQSAVLDELEIALAGADAADRNENSERNENSVSVPHFFTDAEAKPGYAFKPTSRRAELEAERQRLRLQLWGGDAADAE